MDRKLFVFDVNGTLIDSQFGGLKDILVLLGKGKKTMEIEEEYQRRRKFGPWGLDETVSLYKGISRKRMDRLALQYCEKHLMTGAGETIATLKMYDYLVGAISSDADFLLEALKQILSLDFAFGSRLEYKKGTCTGKILEKVDRFKKAKILDDLIREKKIDRKSVIVTGDSITDIPIGKTGGIFIGFNVKGELKDKVDFIVKEKNLEKILPLVL